LQQVVWNLLTNAIKFTPMGGRVDIRLERTDSVVRLTVSDTGKGIRPELLPFVFDRFRQGETSTGRQHGGLGLGLAIVRHIVELHGGVVRAESAGENCGATFAVDLPFISYQAPGFYTRHGWRVFGEIPCDPPGTSRIFMTKTL
jgi:signal transduction histidine kinase